MHSSNIHLYGFACIQCMCDCVPVPVPAIDTHLQLTDDELLLYKQFRPHFNISFFLSLPRWSVNKIFYLWQFKYLMLDSLWLRVFFSRFCSVNYANLFPWRLDNLASLFFVMAFRCCQNGREIRVNVKLWCDLLWMNEHDE